MKKHLFKPGFEFIFTLSLMAVLGLPPLVFGQTTKDMNINIDNGDTTINGKNIKDLSAKDRQAALKDINQIGTNEEDPADTKGHGKKFVKTVVITNDRDAATGESRDIVIEKGSPDDVVFTKVVPDGGQPQRDIIIEKDGDGPMLAESDMKGKTTEIKVRMQTKSGKDSIATYYHLNSDDKEPAHVELRSFRISPADDGPMEFGSRNSQSFSYSSVDNDGVSTSVNFRVSDASPENTKRIAGVDNADLDIKDLDLTAQFSSGKTAVMFSLPSKAVAEVQFKDSQGNVLWSEKSTSGEFSKSFTLGLNGAYYLQVKQAGKVALRKIFKEQM